MKKLSYRIPITMQKIVTTFLLLICLHSTSILYSQKSSQRIENSQLSYALFYSSDNVYLAFNERLKPNALTKHQLSSLLTIIGRVEDSLRLFITYQDTTSKITDTLILTHYFQIVSAKDQKGNGIVWVNALCEPQDGWKRKVIVVDDAASCNYRFKVDMSRRKYFGVHLGPSAAKSGIQMPQL